MVQTYFLQKHKLAFFIKKYIFSHSQKLFCSMQIMLLGFVLLGRSLEEQARLRASSDMNELLVSFVFHNIFL